MSQAIQLSDELLLVAQGAAKRANRTVESQIEHWVQLAWAIEALIDPPAGDDQPVSECLATVDSDLGRERVRNYLNSQPYPHYEPADATGLLVRIDADGTRTVGRFVGREFRTAQ